MELDGYAMSARTRQDWILWAQLGCALVATAHAEYTLVTALGQHWVVAGAVTGALDLYVVRALQKHKDVLPAVLVMVAANVTSILIGAGVVPVHWAVLGAVGALAPLLVWRGHRLRVHEMRVSGAVSAPAPAAPEGAPGTALVQVSDGYTAPDHVPAWVPGFHLDGCDGLHQGTSWLDCAQRAPDHVPAEWVQPGTPHSYPPLAPVPDLPAEYAESAVHSSVLLDTDWAYLDKASEYVHGCKDLKRKPSVRGIRRALSIGQDRAERLLEHLGVEP
jgi:hypothetical protein